MGPAAICLAAGPIGEVHAVGHLVYSVSRYSPIFSPAVLPERWAHICSSPPKAMVGMHMLCDKTYPSSASERLQLDKPLYELPLP